MKTLPSNLVRTNFSPWVCASCRRKSKFSYGSQRAFSSTIALPQLPERAARTRFAPSPTGYLHLGSLRTALFNYLIAKATNGAFLLRIEDTDQKRTIPDAEEKLFQDLEWAGIEWDEGPRIGGRYGPYKQSERTALYRKHADRLMENGHAYRCFCSPERLRTLAEHRSKLGLPPDYDRTCAHILKEESSDRASKGDSYVVRFKAPDTYPAFNDLVYGLVRQKKDLRVKSWAQGSVKSSFDDAILLKSDGFPTYHLANVVDDHLMQITHVIRGAEWMSSTPKHLAMYQAFGWESPAFAHVGLLLDKSKQKLSKRHGSIDVASFRDMGVFPETLANFVALLGWSHSQGSDVMSLDDLIKNASMKFTKGDTVVALEKLWFLQKRHAARYASLAESKSRIAPSHDLNELAVKPIVRLLDSSEDHDKFSLYNTMPEGPTRAEYVRSILFKDAGNYSNPKEFITRHTYFFSEPSPETLKSSISVVKLPKFSASIARSPSPETTPALFDSFADIPNSDFNEAKIRSWIDSIVEQGLASTLSEVDRTSMIDDLETEVKKGWNRLVHQYLRWAISAGMPGPDGANTIKILGKEEVARRLETAKRVFVNNYKQ